MNYDLVSVICSIAVAAMVVLAFYFEYGSGVKKDSYYSQKKLELS